jgi:hypothetical protein
MKYNLRKGAVSEVDVVRRSEFKDNIKECPFGEQASGDNDNRMIYGSEQVTRCVLNAFIPVTEPVTIANAIAVARK